MTIHTLRTTSDENAPPHGGWDTVDTSTFWEALRSPDTTAARRLTEGTIPFQANSTGEYTLAVNERVYRWRYYMRYESTSHVMFKVRTGLSSPSAGDQPGSTNEDFVSAPDGPSEFYRSWNTELTRLGLGHDNQIDTLQQHWIDNRAVEVSELSRAADGTEFLFSRFEWEIDVRTRPVAVDVKVFDGAGVDRAGGIVSNTMKVRIRVDHDASQTDGVPRLRFGMRVYDLGVTPGAGPTDGGFIRFFPAANCDNQFWSERDVELPNGSYRVYNFITAQWPGGEWVSAWSAPTDFEVSFSPPEEPFVLCSQVGPNVELSVEHVPSGFTQWDDPNETRARVQRWNSFSETWEDLSDGQPVTPQNSTSVFVDRFTRINAVYCDKPNIELSRHRARLSGEVDGIQVTTHWRVCELVPSPNGQPFLRHPVDGSKDISVCVDEDGFTMRKPFGAQQSIGGGKPSVSTGEVGGRDTTLVLVCQNTTEVLAALDLLSAPLFLYQPSDIEMPPVWLATEGEFDADTRKVAHARVLTVPCVAVNPEPVSVEPGT